LEDLEDWEDLEDLEDWEDVEDWEDCEDKETGRGKVSPQTRSKAIGGMATVAYGFMLRGVGGLLSIYRSVVCAVPGVPD
jgi:hypothetical protein